MDSGGHALIRGARVERAASRDGSDVAVQHPRGARARCPDRRYRFAENVGSHAIGRRQLRLRGRPAIAAESRHSGSRHRRDRTRAIHLAHAVAAGFGDIDIAAVIRRDAPRLPQDRERSRTAIADPTASRHRTNDIARRLGVQGERQKRNGECDTHGIGKAL